MRRQIRALSGYHRIFLVAVFAAIVATIGGVIVGVLVPLSWNGRLAGAGSFATAIGATVALVVAGIAIFLDDFREDRRSLDAAEAWSATRRLEEALLLVVQTLISQIVAQRFDPADPGPAKTYAEMHTTAMEHLVKCISRCRQTGAFRAMPRVVMSLSTSDGVNTDEFEANEAFLLLEQQLHEVLAEREGGALNFGDFVLRYVPMVEQLNSVFNDQASFRRAWAGGLDLKSMEKVNEVAPQLSVRIAFKTTDAADRERSATAAQHSSPTLPGRLDGD